MAASPISTGHFANRAYAPKSLAEAMERVARSGDQPLRAAFLARALNALAQLAPDLDERVLGDATGAASDYSVLVAALQSADALATLRKQDPLAAARLRGLEARERLLQAEGGTLPAEQVAQTLGITRQAVDKRRRAGRLLALDLGRRGYLYPAWQLHQNGVLAGFDRVLSELRVAPWTQASWFLSGDNRLEGKTPLEELRRGNVEAVCRAARAYGEHGAA